MAKRMTATEIDSEKPWLDKKINLLKVDFRKMMLGWWIEELLATNEFIRKMLDEDKKNG